MTSLTEILPGEVIDQLIDVIADEDDAVRRCETPNVKACSLTCRALASRCRRRIFRSVVLLATDRDTDQFFLYPGATRPLAHLFEKLISNRPEIAKHVRKLYFVLNNVNGRGGLDSEPVTLKGLDNLETFGIGCDNARLHWDKVPAVWRTTFLGFLQRPTITSVILKSIDGFTTSDLLPCTGLKYLSLQGTFIAKDEIFPSNGIPLQLQDVLAFPMAEATANLLKLKFPNGMPVVDARQLKKHHIALHWYYRNVIEKEAELLRLMSHLESVTLIVTSFWEAALQYVPKMLDGVPITTWRSFAMDLYMGPMRLKRGHQNVVNILKSLSTENRIESLELGMILYYEDIHILEAKDWANLKRCLVELAWPCLSRVQLSVFVSPPEPPSSSPGGWDVAADEVIPESVSKLMRSRVTLHPLSTNPNTLLRFELNAYLGTRMNIRPPGDFY